MNITLPADWDDAIRAAAKEAGCGTITGYIVSVVARAIDKPVPMRKRHGRKQTNWRTIRLRPEQIGKWGRPLDDE